ncbi:MAG: Putative two-component sensor histidine kinase [Anaerolinea thermophila]|uniref:Putative two-component sensor histidine kinase n=1 Tax=Anaerolinea thermophila TaxID=167964 RepID=A0A101FY95_9CHLR|nr:MAG: Putative two-component sensor histidine kinase [Anaerolinea thermophila]
MQANKQDFEEREQLRRARIRIGSNGVTTDFILEYLERALPTLLEFINFGEAEIYLKQEKSSNLVRVLHYGDTDECFWLDEIQELGKSPLGKAAQLVEPQVMQIEGEAIAGINPTLLKKGYSRLYCFPIRAESGTLGVLCLAGKKNQKMDEGVEDLLMETASAIGAVIFHERQTLDAKRSIVMEERERIGMDLHDGIIQSLYGVGLSLQNALLREKNEHESDGQIEAALNAINEAIRDIRAYILDLRPRQLRDQNLYTGIESLVREFRANTLIEVTLEKDLKNVDTIPDESSEMLFHICQEALANVAKHARATKVTARLWETPQRVMLKVSDDGVGFDLAKINQRLGHGLSNMTTRAEAVGGGIEVISIRHQGTTVLAWVPNAHQK